MTKNMIWFMEDMLMAPTISRAWENLDSSYSVIVFNNYTLHGDYVYNLAEKITINGYNSGKT